MQDFRLRALTQDDSAFRAQGSIIGNSRCYCVTAFCLVLVTFLAMRYLFFPHRHPKGCADKLEFSLIVFMDGDYVVIELLMPKRSYSCCSFVRTTNSSLFALIYVVGCY
jgi:hypothetical protein